VNRELSLSWQNTGVPTNDLGRRRFLRAAAIGGAGSIAGVAAFNGVAPHVFREDMVFEANQSYWAKALPPANPGLSQSIETDVAIIGGGFSGLSTAYFLKQDAGTKARVALLEAQRCGNGASGRNGAMMLTSTADRYLQCTGDSALDKRIYDLTAENIQKLLRLSRTLGIDAEIKQNGALQVCNTAEDVEQSRHEAEKAHAAGLPWEFWEKAKVTDALGTHAYEGALFDPHSGQVHPGKLVALFRAAAESAGVEIFEQTAVTHIEEGESLTLATKEGHTVKARSLVLATNAYSSKLGFLRQAVAPVFDYVGITAPLSQAKLAAVGWGSRLPFNDRRTQVFYLGLTQDNRIHIGGGPVDYVFNNGVRQPRSDEAHFVKLREELGRIFLAMRDEPFEMEWGGSVDMSLDETPSVGRMGKYENIFYAIGFSGHGVNLTSVFGQVVADLVRGKEEDWRWLPYLNRLPPYIPNEPFRWLGVQAALEYYKLTDAKNP
jgi:gamma-glutamylputrescine oxidase